jgi:hypothetical protein
LRTFPQLGSRPRWFAFNPAVPSKVGGFCISSDGCDGRLAGIDTLAASLAIGRSHKSHETQRF